MSDLLQLHADVQDAADKRYQEEIEVGDESYEITYRQARDPETSAFVAEVGQDKFDEWQAAFSDTQDTDEESLRRLQKLSQKAQNGRLSDDEQDEFERLQEETDDVQDIIYMIAMDPDGVSALQSMACNVVEPDDEDVQEILGMTPDRQNAQFGDYATDEQAAYEMANGLVEEIVTKSTDFSSVMLGLKGLFISQSGGNDQS